MSCHVAHSWAHNATYWMLRLYSHYSAVPFEEDDHDASIWFLDHSYLEIMYKMFKKVNGETAGIAVP